MSDPGDRFDEDLDRFDETTDEEVELDALPGGSLREEVLRQRLAHGLLRLSVESAQAGRKEERVRGILSAIAAEAQESDGVLDAWARFDETLDDEVEFDEMPGGAARDELVRQRVIHALLVAAHVKDAEGGRDRLVSSIVDAATSGGQADQGGGRILRFPGNWTRIAVAAVVMIAAALGLRALLGSERTFPILDAAAKNFPAGVDHRYDVFVEQFDANPEEPIGTHQMWIRPLENGGLCFRLHLDGKRSGQHEVGSDGQVVWRRNLAASNDLDSAPLAEAQRVFDGARAPGVAVRHSDVDDPDHFDLRKLLEKLADEPDVRTEGDVYVDTANHRFQTFYDDSIEHPDFGKLSSVLVRIDLETRVFDVLEFVRPDGDGGGLFRYRFESRGPDAKGTGFYDQPF